MGWVLSNVGICTFFQIFIGSIWGLFIYVLYIFTSQNLHTSYFGHGMFKIVNSYSLESHLLEKEDIKKTCWSCAVSWKKKWTTAFFSCYTMCIQCSETIVRSAGLLETVQFNCGKKWQKAALQRNVLSHDKDHSSPTRSVFVVGPQQVRKTCGLMRTPTHTHRVLQAPRVWTERCNYSHSVASAYAPQATSPSHYQKWGFIILMMHRLKAASPAEITLAGQGGLLISRVHQVCQKRPFVWERICELQPGPWTSLVSSALM